MAVVLTMDDGLLQRWKRQANQKFFFVGFYTLYLLIFFCDMDSTTYAFSSDCRQRRKPFLFFPITPNEAIGTRRNTKGVALFSTEDKAKATEDISPTKKQTVAVVGSGAVGCYYGARLHEGGHKVKFYMREPHFSAVSKNGLNVTSIDGDIFIPAEEIDAYQSTETIGQVDWVLVCLKSTSLTAIPDLILPLLNANTRVLVIMNGLIEDDLIRMLKVKAHESPDMDSPLSCCRALYGGMAFICSNRLSPGFVVHSYAGLLTAGLASSRVNDPTSEEAAFEELWKNVSQVPTTYDGNLLRGRWKKMLWNLPFNGISVATSGLTIDKVMNDEGLRRLASLVMNETRTVAHADLDRVFGEDGYVPLSDEDLEYCMKLSDTMGDYKPSTMLDLTNRRPMEVKYLFEKPLERARALNIPVPHLETLVFQIQAYQRIYNLF